MVLNPIFTQVNLPNTLSKTEKIYGLSKFWQEANYNFVYLNQIDRKKWNQDYIDLIEQVQETENDYEYYRLLQRFCASLKDGHTNVYFPRAIDSIHYTTWFGDYRLVLTNINGKAIITQVNWSKKDEVPIGTEIIAVNGLPTKIYADKYVRPYIVSSTDFILENNTIAWLLQSPSQTRYDLKLKQPDGTLTTLQVTHAEVTEKEVYPPFEDRGLFEFKWLDDGIAYVSLNSFGDPKIDSLFLVKLPELRKAKKLIVDLRYNGGGNTNIGTAILQYLTYDKELYGSATQSRLHIPAYKAWGNWVSPKDTLSGSQEHIRWAKQALLSAQPIFFDLPGGGSFRICTKKNTYPDGRPFVGYGIQPDVFVEKTLKDFMNNLDPALDKAIQYLQNK